MIIRLISPLVLLAVLILGSSAAEGPTQTVGVPGPDPGTKGALHCPAVALLGLEVESCRLSR